MSKNSLTDIFKLGEVRAKNSTTSRLVDAKLGMSPSTPDGAKRLIRLPTKQYRPKLISA